MPADEAGRWRAETLVPAQAEAMRTLFAESFGHAMSPALWQWKYGDGGGLASGVWDRDNRLVAHYGGFPRDILDAGVPRRAVQIGDVMVHPAERGRLTRHGAFYQAATHFLGHQAGTGAPFLHAFGFPNRRALTLGERLGLYHPVGRVTGLEWVPGQGPKLPWYLQLRAWDNHRDARHLERLWRAMRRDFPDALIGVRDGTRMARRYLTHPEQAYALWLLRHRLTRRPLGLVVIRELGDRIEWLDLVAPLDAWDDCALAVLHLARQRGTQRVTLWMTAPFHRHLRVPHQVSDLDVWVPCNGYTPGPTAESQRDRWLLTGGDTDFL